MINHIFWFQHRWRAVAVKKAYGSIINRLNFKKEAENVPMTEVLFYCYCGEVKTKTVKGHWSLKEIRGGMRGVEPYKLMERLKKKGEK